MSTPKIGPQPRAGSDRVVTVPNVMSAIRLASVPVFVWLFVAGFEEAAVALYAVGAWSDFFDGYIARRTGQITELGKVLDPLADRFFIVALAVALVARDVLPLGLALAIVARDVLVLVLFPLLERRGMERIPVNFVGKCATAALLFGLTFLAYSETSWAGAEHADELGMAFTIGGAVLYWIAAVMYAREAKARLGVARQREADA
jgi:cardiolipin synthase (CMP-forming)